MFTTRLDINISTNRKNSINFDFDWNFQITALRCCVELCPFKTILAEKLVDHLEKKHQCRPEDAQVNWVISERRVFMEQTYKTPTPFLQATAQNIIACQQPSGPPTTRSGHGRYEFLWFYSWVIKSIVVRSKRQIKSRVVKGRSRRVRPKFWNNE